MSESKKWKDIDLWKDISDEQWNDWKWQVSHRITTVENLKRLSILHRRRKRHK